MTDPLNKKHFSLDLNEFEKEQKKLHTFKPDLNEYQPNKPGLQEKVWKTFSSPNHDNRRDPNTNIRLVEQRKIEQGKRPISRHIKHAAVISYHEPVYQLDPDDDDAIIIQKQPLNVNPSVNIPI